MRYAGSTIKDREHLALPFHCDMPAVCFRMHPLVIRSNGYSNIPTQTAVTHLDEPSPSRVQLHIAGIPSFYGNADSYDHIHVNAHTDGDSDAHINRYTDEYAHADRDSNPDDHAHADDQPDGDLRFPRRYRTAAGTLSLWSGHCLSACWRLLCRRSRTSVES